MCCVCVTWCAHICYWLDWSTITRWASYPRLPESMQQRLSNKIFLRLIIVGSCFRGECPGFGFKILVACRCSWELNRNLKRKLNLEKKLNLTWKLNSKPKMTETKVGVGPKCSNRRRIWAWTWTTNWVWSR